MFLAVGHLPRWHQIAWCGLTPTCLDPQFHSPLWVSSGRGWYAQPLQGPGVLPAAVPSSLHFLTYMRSPSGIWGYLLCSKSHCVSNRAVPLCFFSPHNSYSEFDIKCNCLFALDSAVDLTSFQGTSPLEMMTAFVLKFFRPIGMEISKQNQNQKTKRRVN